MSLRIAYWLVGGSWLAWLAWLGWLAPAGIDRQEVRRCSGRDIP
jgi:threonine/homoserine/homoserine lactone efflux protein